MIHVEVRESPEPEPLAPCARCGEDISATASTCPECGEDPDSEDAPCYTCRGEGYRDVADMIETISGPRPSPWTSERFSCEDCQGTGTVEALYAKDRQEALSAFEGGA